MKFKIFQIHEKMVLRNILWTYLILMTLVEYIFFFPILKNFFLTVLILSHHNWSILFHNVSNFLVFMLSGILVFLLYWLFVTFLISIVTYGLYTLKCPQYLIYTSLLITTSIILGYLFTDMHFYGYMHRHLHDLFDLQLIQSTFFLQFLKNCSIFFIASIFVFFLSESFYLRFSIRFLDKIFLFFCTIIIFIFSISLTLYKFSTNQILPTYLNHFIGLQKLVYQYPGDNFFYVENRPEINTPLFHNVTIKPYNIVIFFIDHLSHDDINHQKTPFIKSFQKDNINFTRHIAGGETQKEFLFTLLYGLPVYDIPSVLAHQTKPTLFKLLQHHGYHINTNQPKSFFPFHLNGLLDQDNLNENPFISFYNLSIQRKYLKASYQYNDQFIKNVILLLKNKHQYQNTIIMITGLNHHKDSIFTPLIIHWPDMKTENITYLTSNYDIITTLTAYKPNPLFNFNLFEINRSQFIPVKYLSTFRELHDKTPKINIKEYDNFNKSKYLFKQEGNVS